MIIHVGISSLHLYHNKAIQFIVGAVGKAETEELKTASGTLYIDSLYYLYSEFQEVAHKFSAV